MKTIALLLLSITCFSASAQSVAVLDSGVDIFHPTIRDSLRENRLESANGKDDDGNGLIDDLWGWNFADNKSELLDPNLRASWPTEAYQYYWVRMKRSFGTWNSAEEAWYLASREDEDFMEVRSNFSSYIHGTHVAAIALHGPMVVPAADVDLPIPTPYQVKSQSQRFQLLPIRYLGDYDYIPWRRPSAENIAKDLPLSEREAKYRRFFRDYYQWQMGKLKMALDYATSFEDVRVINGSFGLSYHSTADMIADFLEEFHLDSLGAYSPAELAREFLAQLNRDMAAYARSKPRVLFTFSAGNSDEDTDQNLHFPSGATSENIVSVGASLAFKERAYFSNYGKESVDLFAPGLAILSAVSPSDELPINGTSQAAPFVAHLALELFALNSTASAGLIKHIISKTTDSHAQLKELCRTSGIVNPARAKQAMRLLMSGLSMKEALKRARILVPNASKHEFKQVSKKGKTDKVDPLPNPFLP